MQVIIPQVSGLCLLRLPCGDGNSPHARQICGSLFALGNGACDVARRPPVVAEERFGNRELIGPIHVPVPARRVEWVVRVGKGHHQKEGSVTIPVQVEPGGGALRQ